MQIGIIGNGFVGNATRQLICNDINILSYDITPNLCDPLGTTLKDLLNCEFIFVSVPTPMKENGECYIDIVKAVVNELKSFCGGDRETKRKWGTTRETGQNHKGQQRITSFCHR